MRDYTIVSADGTGNFYLAMDRISFMAIDYRVASLKYSYLEFIVFGTYTANSNRASLVSSSK